MIKRDIKLGKKFDELSIGDKLHISETITDKDLLLFLGITNDNNPLYIQHDFAKLTPFSKPIVPTILLNGILTAAVSKHLPGPGSHINELHVKFLAPVYHDEMIHIHLEIEELIEENQTVIVNVHGFNEQNEAVIAGKITVLPPTFS